MDIVLSSAAHHAVLFALLAKETIDTFGEEGKQAVKDGVNRYGEQRGRRMALRTLADGNELNVENYLVYGEWSAFPGQMDLRFSAYTPEVRMQNYRCPWYAEWTKRGLRDLGLYYCQYVDAALARGYNGMELSLQANKMRGDECCKFVFKGCSVPKERMEAFKKKCAKIGKKAKMPWEYHIGHIFCTMTDVITSAFGSEGKAAAARALDAYEKEYGSEAKAFVLRYADIDYDMMPEYAGIEGINTF